MVWLLATKKHIAQQTLGNLRRFHQAAHLQVDAGEQLLDMEEVLPTPRAMRLSTPTQAHQNVCEACDGAMRSIAAVIAHALQPLVRLDVRRKASRPRWNRPRRV